MTVIGITSFETFGSCDMICDVDRTTDSDYNDFHDRTKDPGGRLSTLPSVLPAGRHKTRNIPNLVGTVGMFSQMEVVES